ncbi:MAG: hypothetical protein ACJAYU_005155 [Bradymonadia bacterium]|jgi:hypothetical protein
MTQPNFLQVQNSLDRAVEFVKAHPDLESSRLYGEGIEEMQAVFGACTTRNDVLYTKWRVLLGLQGGAARDVKLEYDRVLELADEHAYDDAPKRPIVYSDEEQLLPLVRETIAWLAAKGEQWEWTAKKIASLEELLEDASRRRKISDDARIEFTADVKRRIGAYDASVALIREYLKDAKREGEAYESFAALKLDIL